MKIASGVTAGAKTLRDYFQWPRNRRRSFGSYVLLLKLHGSVDWSVQGDSDGAVAAAKTGNPLNALSCDGHRIAIATPGISKRQLSTTGYKMTRRCNMCSRAERPSARLKWFCSTV